MIIKKKINLVTAAKHPVRVRKQMDKLYVVLNLVIVILLAGIMLTAIIMNISARREQEMISGVKAQISAAEKQIALQINDRKKLASLTKYSEEIGGVLLSLKVSPKLTANVFTSIWQSLPEKSTLGSFNISGGGIKCTIKAESAHYIVDFIDNLRAHEVFSSVSYSGSITLSDNMYSSVINLLIAEGSL